MTGSPWKGDDSGIKPFGRKAQQWLRRVITRRLEAMDSPARRTLTYGLQGYSDADIPRIVADLLDADGAAAMRYVTWVDAEEYRGGGYSNGAWVVQWDRVDRDIADAAWYARRAAQRERDAIRFPTLDDWLRADIAGALEYPGMYGDAEELTPEQAASLKAAAVAREQRRPVRCSTCGEFFARDRRNARRCPSCRERARAILHGHADDARTELERTVAEQINAKGNERSV